MTGQPIPHRGPPRDRAQALAPPGPCRRRRDGHLHRRMRPSTGALGTPATQPPTGLPSIEAPSDDATPDPSSPTPAPTPSASPDGLTRLDRRTGITLVAGRLSLAVAVDQHRGHDHRPCLLLPRQLHGQRRARAGAARDPADPGRRDRSHARPASRSQCQRARRPPRDVHGRAGRHPTARPFDQGRGRDRGPLGRVRVGRRPGGDPRATGPGRLHPHPILDRGRRQLRARRAAGDRLRRRRDRARPPGRTGRLHRPAAGHLHGSAGRGAALGHPGRVSGMANVFEATFQGASPTRRAPSLSTAR